MRFAQLLEVCADPSRPFTLNDYGCGYGALAQFLAARGYEAGYRGFDLSAAMLEHARREHGRPPAVTFVDSEEELERADYTVASGIFNVKLDTPTEEWEAYVARTLTAMSALSTHGFAFNMLTSYSDEDRMRPDLYYGDPRFYFDHCKRNFSRNVSLLHDYGLYEFTMIVRSDE